MLFKEIAPILRPLYKLRLFVVLVSAIHILIGLLPPYLMGVLIDDLHQMSGAPVYYTIAFVAGLLLVWFFLDWLQRYLWADMINRGAGMVRSFLFANVLHKDYRFFRKYPEGDIDSRVINDAYIYAQAKLAQVPTLILNILHIIVIIAILVRLNHHMTLMTLVLSLLFFGLYGYVNKFLRGSAVREREGFSDLMSEASSTVLGINTIQLYNVESFFADRFEKSVDRYERLLTKLKFWQALSSAATNTITSIIPVAAILAGMLYLLYGGNITVGSIIAFYYFLPRLKEPIKALTDFNMDVQNARAVETRLEELLSHEEPERADLAQIKQIDALAFREMGFTFPDGETILHDLNVNLSRGDILAVTGPSGTGKSTLLQLLKRQIDPTEGDILINGKSHVDVCAGSYLSRIAVMTQDVFLIDGSLQDNISFGREIPEAVIQEAARLSAIDPAWLEGDVLGLSGGEVARVGLARALASDYDVLILDEPTASLDAETERQIIENLKEVQKQTNCMMIVITHSRNVLRDLCTQELQLKQEKAL
ncbi:MAG: ABC transporter ATP-binding protein/permease [Oscillospiraceae bacterium]|nr:ABC transporter ATP-binding protein/permease [Oscillospiraceae bacterium]